MAWKAFHMESWASGSTQLSSRKEWVLNALQRTWHWSSTSWCLEKLDKVILKCTRLFSFPPYKFLALCWEPIAVPAQECLVGPSHNSWRPCRVMCIKHHIWGGRKSFQARLPRQTLHLRLLGHKELQGLSSLTENWGGERGRGRAGWDVTQPGQRGLPGGRHK